MRIYLLFNVFIMHHSNTFLFELLLIKSLGIHYQYLGSKAIPCFRFFEIPDRIQSVNNFFKLPSATLRLGFFIPIHSIKESTYRTAGKVINARRFPKVPQSK
jgi:hypothetical protein